MKEILNFLKKLSFNDYALEIFLFFLILNWLFYFLKYYNIKVSILLSLIIIFSWVIFFIRLKEELEKNEK